jgi:hypothetical protein
MKQILILMGCRNSGQMLMANRVKSKYGKSCRLEDFWSLPIDMHLGSVYSQHYKSLISFEASNRSTLVWTQSWFERQALVAHGNRWQYDDDASFDLLLRLSLSTAQLVFCYLHVKDSPPTPEGLSDYFAANVRLSQNLEDCALSDTVAAVLPSLRVLFDKAKIFSISVDKIEDLISVDLPI